MIRRKLLLDTKVLLSSFACDLVFVAIALIVPGRPNDPLALFAVGVGLIAAIYGMFGGFFSGMSVASRHSRRIKLFWEGLP